MKQKILTQAQIEKFKKHLISEEKSRNTIEKYIRDVTAFSVFTMGRSVTKDLVLTYKKSLEEQYTPTSVNSMLAAINSLFEYLGWDDCKVKTIKIQKPTCRPEEKDLNKNEFDRLINACERKRKTRLYFILLTIFCMGIRISELQFVTVEAVRDGKAVVRCKGKTRTVFIVSKLQKKLLRYIAEQHITTGSIFITRTGKPIDRTNIWKEMKAICKDAHVNPSKVFPHNLRHLFAKVFYKAQKDLAKLADFLGHSNINTTKIYVMTTCDEHKNVLENVRFFI